MSASQASKGTRRRQPARIIYNHYSRWYDLLSFGMENGLRNLAVERLAPCPGARVLEIGFGTGHSIVQLAEQVGDSGKVFGIDISNGMAKVTLSRVKRTGFSDRVFLILGDGQQLPYCSNTFDHIFISFTLELFDTPTIPQVLSECRESLRHGGRICVLGISRKGASNAMRRLYEWLHKRLPQYIDCRPINVEESLERAGFHILNASEHSLAGLCCELVLAEKLSSKIQSQIRLN